MRKRGRGIKGGAVGNKQGKIYAWVMANKRMEGEVNQNFPDKQSLPIFAHNVQLADLFTSARGGGGIEGGRRGERERRR